MKNRLRVLISSEDPRNPYTDEQIALHLNAKRYEITALRRKMGIPDSRERRKSPLLNEMRKILAEECRISNRELTRRLNEVGFDVSRFVVSETRKEVKVETPDPPPSTGTMQEKKTRLETNYKVFTQIIGHDRSLRPQIKQAMAAILYPPLGLHTLILGETGVGKSSLAEFMYHFALEAGKLPPGAPFITFSCADYSDNPQLLLSQLFGHVRGAFTGANTDKIGLVEKADGGILFLDEVHRLNPEGQELLFLLMDKGIYRRLGETDRVRRANVMIIGATTEDIDSSLLLTFRRRIPMTIHMPSLPERSLQERYCLIKHFYGTEADRIGVRIKIGQEVIRALLLYDCPGNIGQLRSDIQVSCARAYLSFVSAQDSMLVVQEQDLPGYVRQGLLSIQTRQPEVMRLLRDDVIVLPGEQERRILPEEDLYILPQEIYHFIESEYQNMSRQGLPQEQISRAIGEQLELKFRNMVKQVGKAGYQASEEDLAGIAGRQAVDLTREMLSVAEARLGKVDQYLFYCLAMHLGATLERIRQGKPIINPQLESVKRDYHFEYELAREMISKVEARLGFTLPEDETAFVAMYLHTVMNHHESRSCVGVAVLSHGNVARGMADVANRLLGVDHAVGQEMALDEKPEAALEKAKDLVQKIDRGKGVLLLIDMGSFLSFGEIITRETGIPTQTVDRVDTLMVVEAVRLSLLDDSDLETIARRLRSQNKKAVLPAPNPGSSPSHSDGKKVLVTLCITGEGSARKIKGLLEQMLPGIGRRFEIIPVGVIGRDSIAVRLEAIWAQRQVEAIIGTVKPADLAVPFISIEEIISGDGLKRLSAMAGIAAGSQAAPARIITVSPLMKTIHEELIFIRPPNLEKHDLLDTMAAALDRSGYTKEGFLLDVYRREIIGSTMLENGVAIPHGSPGNVLKPSVAVAVLDQPLPWVEKQLAEYVFMLALQEDSEPVVLSLYRLIKDRQFLQRLKQLSSPADIKQAFLEHLIAFD